MRSDGAFDLGGGFDATAVDAFVGAAFDAAFSASPLERAAVDEVVSPVAALGDELAELVTTFIAELRCRVDRVAADGSARDLAVAVQQIERVVRAGEGTSAQAIEAVDRRGLFVEDGHHDAKAWMRATVQLAPVDAARRHRLGRFGRHNPEAADALSSGQLGVAQANQLALTWTNPRVREQVERRIREFLDEAVVEPFDVFKARVDEWERLSDQDGAFAERDTIHNGRDARFLNVDATSYVRGRFGTLQGEALKQVFDAFCDAEYRFDRDEAKQRLGRDQVSEADLARTPAQRRADAFFKMVMAAAVAPLDGKQIDVTVDIVIDEATFERRLTELLDPLHRRDLDLTPTAQPCGFDPDSGPGDERAVRAMCHTTHGAPVDPTDAVAAAMIGHVRRVVWGARSVVTDLGRRARLFTGSIREAAYLQAAIDARDRCVYPGCRHRPRQIDHSKPYGQGGQTRLVNAGGCCEHHNLFKQGGYLMRRDEHGRWHTYRPDGTEIAAS